MLIDLHGVRSEIQTMLLYNIMFCRTWCQKWDLLHAATDSPFVHGVRGGIQNHADILVMCGIRHVIQNHADGKILW